MEKTIINPPDLAYPTGFSHGILVTGGRLLFLAGQTGSNSEGQIIAPGDLVAQYEQTLRNLQTVVEAAGGKMQDITKLSIFIRDRDDYLAHLKRMGELGFLAGPVEPEYGGSGMDYVSYVLLCEELGRVDSSVRGFLTVHTSLVSLCIRDWGTEVQKRHYLPLLVTGEWIGCYALTDPEAGSDVANMES